MNVAFMLEQIWVVNMAPHVKTLLEVILVNVHQIILGSIVQNSTMTAVNHRMKLCVDMEHVLIYPDKVLGLQVSDVYVIRGGQVED